MTLKELAEQLARPNSIAEFSNGSVSFNTPNGFGLLIESVNNGGYTIYNPAVSSRVDFYATIEEVYDAVKRITKYA
jgi:hypothetical protein